jgi:hypothetical protein
MPRLPDSYSSDVVGTRIRANYPVQIVLKRAHGWPMTYRSWLAAQGYRTWLELWRWMVRSPISGRLRRR